MTATLKPLIKQGWLRALVYTVFIFLVIFLFDALIGFAMVKVSGNPGIVMHGGIESFIVLYTISAAGVFLCTWLFMKYIDRKPFATLGFQWSGFSNDAWMGFFSGLVILGIGSLLLVLFRYLVFTGLEWNSYALFLEFVAMIVVAFTEETIFRGYLLNNLLQSLNKWMALAISAVLFVLIHGANPNITPLSLLNIFAAGIMLGINYIYTRNLWFSILFHFSWNLFQGPVLGYEVSGLPLQSLFKQSLSGPEIFTGGPFGFEGSLLCVLLTVVLTLILYAVFHKRDLAAKAETNTATKS